MKATENRELMPVFTNDSDNIVFRHQILCPESLVQYYICRKYQHSRHPANTLDGYVINPGDIIPYPKEHPARKIKCRFLKALVNSNHSLVYRIKFPLQKQYIDEIFRS
jgi:hypothetical protein